MDHEKLLPITSENLSSPQLKVFPSEDEIHPRDLSPDHGEGHGHGLAGGDASMFGAALNIANNVMGAGVLALPNVCKQLGVLVGSAVIVLSYLITYFTCILLLKCKNLCHHSKYISLGKYCFGSGGMWIVKIVIILNTVGISIVYLIVFSTVCLNLLRGFEGQCVSILDSPFYCSHYFLVLVGAAIVAPFVYADSIAKLQGASAVAVMAAIIFCVVTVLHYIVSASEGHEKQEINVLPTIEDIPDALASITAVFLAYTFQFNFSPIYKTLRDPSDKKMRMTTLMGLSIVLVIYLGVANCGYLTFGKDAGNLLVNFTKERLGLTVFVIVNVAFLCSSTMTLPLMFFAAKNEIYGGIKLLRKKWQTRNEVEEVEETEEEAEADEGVIEEKYGFRGVAFNLYVTILFGIIVLLAIFIPEINTIFSFLGSTAANAVNILLPTIFYLRLSPKKGRYKLLAKIVLGFGIIMGSVGIVASAMSSI